MIYKIMALEMEPAMEQGGKVEESNRLKKAWK
jgi:hypothetical protein